MTNKVKKHIGFRYILIEIQMCIWFFCDWIHSTRSITQNQWQVHNIIHNIFKIPSDNSIICGSYCILFIEYILAGKVRLYQFRNLPKENKIIYKYSKDKCQKNVSLDFRLAKYRWNKKLSFRKNEIQRFDEWKV